jgi:AcrR family transcriptional regulator
MTSQNDEQGPQKGTARERVLDAARALFSEYGVSGTSLHMIADHLGVTKAAVYHQFHAKEDIVLALLEKPVAELRPIVAEAETMGTRERQLDVLLPGLVDVVIENPEAVAMIEADPAVARLIQGRDEYRDVVGRLTAILAGPRPEPAARVASAIYGAGLMLIGHHTLMAGIDAETMRRELPRIGRRLLL